MNETFYKNVRPVPRTLDEALKTATYAQPFWKCETEAQRGLSALFEKFLGLALLFLFGFAVSGFTLWLTRT
jgi:hypothetical protein